MLFRSSDEMQDLLEFSDRNDDGDISKSEFRNFAYQLDISRTDKSDIDKTYRFLKDGESTIDIAGVMDYLVEYSSSGDDWSVDDFDKITAAIAR